MGRWRVRPVGDRVRYGDALKLRTKRMETLIDVPRKGTIEIKRESTTGSNVVPLRRKAAS